MAQLKKLASRWVPANPTLWPQMVFGAPVDSPAWPFIAPDARYFYFARNAVWRAARLLGLHDGEVLVPAYHHGVEVEALVDAGADVKFYRVGARWDVDLEDVESRIGPRTRALYLIHYAGFPGPAAEMRAMADRHGLVLIEDCALSLLSCDGAQPMGSVGDAGIYCLYKTLPVPNGGALVLNRTQSIAEPDPAPPPWTSTVSHVAAALLANVELRGGRFGRWAARAVRALGRGTFNATGVQRVGVGTRHFTRSHVHLGMSALSRRIMGRQDFARIVEARRRNYFVLLARLREVAPPLLSQLPAGVCPLFYPLVVADKGDVMVRLQARGVETIDFWRHFHPGCDASKFPEAATLRRTVLEVPCHQDLTPEGTAHVAEVIRECLTKPSGALRLGESRR